MRSALARTYAESIMRITRNHLAVAVGTGVLAAPLGGPAATASPTSKTTIPTVTVTLEDGAISASSGHAASGPTVFVVRNRGSEPRVLVVARHRGALPHFFFLAAVPFVPKPEVSGRLVLPIGGEGKLKLTLRTGHYLLVDSQTTGGTRIIANAFTGLVAREV